MSSIIKERLAAGKIVRTMHMVGYATPRFVEMLDKGQYNAKALATSVVPIEKMLEGYEEVLYRTTVTGIMTG